MGLKGFHVFFIFMSALMCFGIATWRADAFMGNGNTLTLLHALAWAVAGACLVIYEIGFVRKTKELSYL